MFSNTCVNLFIYIGRQRDFRRALKRELTKLCCCLSCCRKCWESRFNVNNRGPAPTLSPRNGPIHNTSRVPLSPSPPDGYTGSDDLPPVVGVHAVSVGIAAVGGFDNAAFEVDTADEVVFNNLFQVRNVTLGRSVSHIPVATSHEHARKQNNKVIWTIGSPDNSDEEVSVHADQGGENGLELNTLVVNPIDIYSSSI